MARSDLELAAAHCKIGETRQDLEGVLRVAVVLEQLPTDVLHVGDVATIARDHERLMQRACSDLAALFLDDKAGDRFGDAAFGGDRAAVDLFLLGLVGHRLCAFAKAGVDARIGGEDASLFREAGEVFLLGVGIEGQFGGGHGVFVRRVLDDKRRKQLDRLVEAALLKPGAGDVEFHLRHIAVVGPGADETGTQVLDAFARHRRFKARRFLVDLERFEVAEDRRVHGLLDVAIDRAGGLHQLRRRRRLCCGRRCGCRGRCGHRCICGCRLLQQCEHFFVLAARLYVAFAGEQRLGVVPLDVQALGRVGEDREVSVVGPGRASVELLVVLFFGERVQPRRQIAREHFEVAEDLFVVVGSTPPVFVAGGNLGQHRDVFVGVVEVFRGDSRLVDGLAPLEVAVDVVTDADKFAIHFRGFVIHRLDLKPTRQLLERHTIFIARNRKRLEVRQG